MRMGIRKDSCAKEEGMSLNRGAWTAGEDKILTDYINAHGEGKWRSLPNRAGLKRCGKSCRLRWLNYLRPDIKRGNISQDEQDLILRLHKLLGNRWSLIAGRLPGRTDNEIKNYWNTIMSKKLLHPPPPAPRRHNTHKPSTAAIPLPPPPHAIKTKPTKLISSSNSKLPFITTTTTTTPTATTTSSAPIPILDPTSSKKQQQPCSLMSVPSSSSSSGTNNNNIHTFGFPSTTDDFHQNIITNNNDYGGLLFPDNFNWMGAGYSGGINIFNSGNVYYDEEGVFSQFPETGVVMEDWVLD